MKFISIRRIFITILTIIININISISSPYEVLTAISQTDKASVDLENSCYCDMNSSMCDPYCCCDDLCSKVNIYITYN